MKTRARVLVAALALGFAVALSSLFAPGLAESVARANVILGGVCALAPFPVSEVALIAIPCALLRPRKPLRTLMHLLTALTAALVALSIFWAPLFAAPALDVPGMEASELKEMCLSLAYEANALRAGESGRFALSAPLSDICSEAAALVGMATGAPVSAPKVSRYPELLDLAGASGMYVPFAFEAVVNPNELDCMLPFTACHEAAHQAGYAREAEASLVAYRACRRGDATFRYSAAVYLLIESMRQLRAVDATAHAACVSAMNEAVRADYESARGNADSALSDIMLTVSGQGLAGYGDVVALVWADFSPSSDTYLTFG